MSRTNKSIVDHLPAWTCAALVGLYALIALRAAIEMLAPPTEHEIRDGLGGVIVFAGLAALYASIALLQIEHSLIRVWEPSLRQALTFAWVTGWVWLVVAMFITSFRDRGLPGVRDSLVAAVVILGVFVVVPWGIAKWRVRAKDIQYEGFTHD